MMNAVRKTSAAVGAAVAMLAAASLAHAHGGMAGPDEIGPPLFTSFALGFVCYWLVILWPSSKSKGDAPGGSTEDSNKTRRARRRMAARARSAHDSNHLTKVAGRGRS
jgi:hypothetical protein